MEGTESICISGLNIILHHEKAMFIPQESLLIISDLHLGKIEHFRKNGVALPTGNTEKTIKRLDKLILQFSPKKILFLGDLFHSDYNSAIEYFYNYISGLGDTTMILAKGNHDILTSDVYTSLGIQCVDTYKLEDIIFSHEPLEAAIGYNIYGHIHPAVKMKSVAKQKATLSCFLFTDSQAIMPAFGQFTGKFIIRPKQGDTVFVVFDDNIMKV